MAVEDGALAGSEELSESLAPGWLKSLHGDYRTFFGTRLAQMEKVVWQLQQDGLSQITPVVLATGKTVSQLRREMGRAVWRRIHHDTEKTNFLKCLIWLKYRGEASWAEVVSLPDAHLRSCRNAIDWPTARFAAHLAQPGQFAQVSMLYRDTIKMGGQPRSGWSLQRLRREHNHLAARLAIKRASPVPWADRFVFQQDGYVFTRLVSDREFVAEGKAQRHCIAAYISDARAGECVAMSCTGAHRATLRFGTEGDWELSGFANEPVPGGCLKAARAARAAFLSAQCGRA